MAGQEFQTNSPLARSVSHRSIITTIVRQKTRLAHLWQGRQVKVDCKFWRFNQTCSKLSDCPDHAVCPRSCITRTRASPGVLFGIPVSSLLSVIDRFLNIKYITHYISINYRPRISTQHPLPQTKSYYLK